MTDKKTKDHSNNNYNDESKYDVGHVYEEDIHELNHPAPMWWQLIFYASIIFGIGYIAYYEFLGGPTLKQELDQKMAQIETLRKANQPAGISDDDLNAFIKDASNVTKGKTIYAGKCASCHGNDGQGIIGPNLTDNFWIHGGKPAQVLKVVKEGVLDKGMPPWNGILSDNETLTVVAYLYSLKGTHPANPKAPQGEELK